MSEIKFNHFTGVNMLTRKLANSAKPKVSLIKNSNGTYSFRSSAGLLGTNIDFIPDVEFDEKTMERGVCRSVISFEGNRMIHIQRGDKEVKIVREFDDENMLMTMYVDDQVARRFFKSA